jgi:PEP-CTERM motif
MKKLIFAIASLSVLTAQAASANPDPTETPVNPYESLAAPVPQIQSKVSSAPMSSSSGYDVVIKAEPERWVATQEIPEPASALALIAIASAVVAGRRRSNQTEG